MDAPIASMNTPRQSFEECKVGDYCPIELSDAASEVKTARPRGDKKESFDVLQAGPELGMPPTPLMTDHMVFHRTTHEGREVWMRRS